MKVAAVIRARGRGSSLPGKNMYELDGEPLIWHFLKEVTRATCLDHIFVWTEDSKMESVVEQFEKVSIIPRPLEMVYPPMSDEEELAQDESITRGIVNHMGCWPEVIFDLNCNEILLTANVIDTIFDFLMERGDVSVIRTMYHIDPNVYLAHKGHLFSLLTEQGVDRQDQPQLARMAYTSCKYNKRMKDKSKTVYMFRIPSYMGFDFQHEDDIPYAEYMLERRAAQCSAS